MNKKKLNQEVFDEINGILMKWNPIGVYGPALNDEYHHYIPQIFRIGQSKEELTKYFINLLDELGLEFDSNNKKYLKDIDDLSKQVMNIVSSYDIDSE